MTRDDWRKYCAEFIGTFTLVIFAAGAVVVDGLTGGGLGMVGAGLLSGLVITVVIYAFGHISGAHVNPALSVAACLIGLVPVAKRAFAALRSGMPFTIEMLMTMAAGGALFIGAAAEAAMVIFLFAIGEVLEGVAADRARAGIRALANLVPKTARLVEGETVREVPAESLSIGQIVLVRPGDRIPADGEIAEGMSGIDESPVTGESMPKVKGPGEPVFAGSINAEAALRLRVTRDPEDNTIARIIRLVEEEQEAKAPTERFIDRISRGGLEYLDLSRARNPADWLPLRTGHFGARVDRLRVVGGRKTGLADERRRGVGGCRQDHYCHL